MNVDGQTAIITGGASGLGEGTARELAEAGAKVAIWDIQEDKGMAVAKEIGGVFCKCDVTSEDSVLSALGETKEALGVGRILVNCAGTAVAIKTSSRGEAHPLDQFQRIITINLIGTFNCIRLATTAMIGLDPMEHGERGVVINTASVAAFDGQIGQAAYSASKGGVVGLTLPVARDLSALGIRVNTIAPGLIDTPIYGTGEASDKFKANLGSNVLFPKRLGVATELASMVCECITNDYMNGEVIRVDGGIRMPPK